MAYCTERDLKDVYPSIDEFDTKTPLYGWTALVSHAGHYLYQATNSGLVTTLFANGEELSQFLVTESYVDSTTNTDEPLDKSETVITVLDASVFEYDDVIKIDNEKMLIVNKSSNNLTVIRGFLGTAPATHNTNTDVYIGIRWNDQNQSWFYSSDVDAVFYHRTDTTNPNDMLMESGDDWGTIKTRYISNAEKYLDSRLDAKLPRKQFKDQDGNYDYVIVRTAALLACSFLIRSTNPTSEIADALFDEAEKNIFSLNDGSTKLSWQTTGDASMGIIREGTVSGNVRIVDTRGAYTGIYDKIGVKITTAGALGTAKYSYWAKDSENLGSEKMNNGDTATFTDTINGTYQPVGNGLYVRFAGDTGDTAALNDYWEIEVHGRNEVADNSYPNSIRMTRR